MILTTSATTVTTVTYLSLYELENYKKTFQSFWIPFMEQFIPATTIWIAGERWCNEPCTVIDSCDYDFELVESEVSIQPTQQTSSSYRELVVSRTSLPTTLESTVSSVDTLSEAEIISNPPNIVETVSLGLETSKPLILTQKEFNIDIKKYRSKFLQTTKIIEYI